MTGDTFSGVTSGPGGRRELLGRTLLLRGLAAEQLDQLGSLAAEIVMADGATIISEGDPSERVWVVIRGEVEIVKGEADADGLHRIATLGEMETVGELGLVDNRGASASVRTLVPSRLLVIPIQAIRQLMGDERAARVIYENLSLQLNRRLRYTNEVTVRALANELEQFRARVGLAVTLVTLVILVTFYTYCLGLLASVAQRWGSTTVVTIPLSLLIFAVVCYKIRNSGFPMRFFGLTTVNWKRVVAQSLVYTMPILLLVVIVKWIFIRFLAENSEMDLIHARTLLAAGDYASLRKDLLGSLVYVALIVPVQEFIARGAMQSLLQHFLTGPHHLFWAVISSNLMFSVAHLFMSPQFAFVSFFFGLFWGSLFARQGSLIGPVVSHALVGVWGLNVVGVRGFLM